MNIDLVRALLAHAALASRAEAIRNAEEARQQGRLQEIRVWRSRLRKIDRRIAQYKIEPLITGLWLSKLQRPS